MAETDVVKPSSRHNQYIYIGFDVIWSSSAKRKINKLDLTSIWRQFSTEVKERFSNYRPGMELSVMVRTLSL